MTIHYRVDLESDVTFFARAGAGAAVDFVPGLVMLGHVAKRMYDTAMSAGLHWDIFHSGATRFGDARIVHPEHDHAARVIPLSFKFAKGAEGRYLGDFAADALQDKVVDPKTTLKQDRPGAQTWASGQLTTVSSRTDLKTSVLYDSQRAREGALFSLVSLTRGQSFRGKIECSSSEARRWIEDHLYGPARLGRSRRAEYGRVTIEPVGEPTGADWAQGAVLEGGQRFLLLSDTCLLDPRTGLPTTIPSPAHFGLNGGTLDRARTCVRVSRFSPFNGHHRRPTMERVALRAGSVICFDAVQTPINDSELWIGAHTAEGLGHVWVNPPSLEGWQRGKLDERVSDAPDRDLEVPDDTLGRWLAAQNAARVVADDAEQAADAIVADVGAPSQPGPSQWRRLADQVRAEGVQAALGEVCKRGVAARRWKGVLPKLEKAIEGRPPLAVALAAETLARTAGGDR